MSTWIITNSNGTSTEVEADNMLEAALGYLQGEGYSIDEAPANIYDYFTLKLGDTPSDSTLTQLGCRTACGRDCILVIDAAAALAHHVDPSVVASVLQTTEEALGVLWHG